MNMNRNVFLNFVFVIAVLVGSIGKSEAVEQALPDQTANWETYRNEIYGIEFEYPANWSILEENKDISQRDALKQFGGDNVQVVMLSDNSESRVAIFYFGTNLNFSDCPDSISKEECLKSREVNKMGLDRFIEFAGRNESFQNVKKTLFNEYPAYEIDFKTKVSTNGGKTYREENGFIIMMEGKDGGVFKIHFADRPTKSDLSSAEQHMLSTFKLIP